ncbi:MAG: response regulator [bacterium]
MTIRVFVFDDDESVRTTFARMLSRLGYEVITFSRAALCDSCKCLDGQVCADIIISDVDMPGVTGLEFIAGQRMNGCKASSVALMSGKWTESGLQRARELGCHIFQKPLNIQEMKEWLEHCQRNILPGRTLAPWFQQDADPQGPGDDA